MKIPATLSDVNLVYSQFFLVLAISVPLCLENLVGRVIIGINNIKKHLLKIKLTSICTRSAGFFNESRRTKVPKLYSKESMSSGTF